LESVVRNQKKQQIHSPKSTIMSHKQRIFLAIGFCYLFIAACSKNQADEPSPAEPNKPTTKVTYSNFVGGLFQTKCASCHAPGRPQASFWTFNGYSSVISNADQIRNLVIVTKVMPQGGSLSAAELKSLQDWYDQGKLE
jgi:hypothetical protein